MDGQAVCPVSLAIILMAMTPDSITLKHVTEQLEYCARDAAALNAMT